MKIYGEPIGRLSSQYWRKINDDNIWDGAAALAYYLMLAVFPAAIFLLTLLPFLPIPDLSAHVMGSIQNVLPPEAANLLRSTVEQITHQKRQGLLSFGLLFTLWSASSGMVAIMQTLNTTYDVKDTRSFTRTRLIALGLMLLFGLLIVAAVTLLVFDQKIQGPIVQALQLGAAGTAFMALIRVSLIIAALLLGFSLVYHFGPDVKQRFRLISPGSTLGVACLIIASLAIKVYVRHFADFAATYGSLGAAIILILSLYVMGIVLLLGSELNALLEQHRPPKR